MPSNTIKPPSLFARLFGGAARANMSIGGGLREHAIRVGERGYIDLGRQFKWLAHPVFSDFKRLYQRNPIAHRAITAYPQACWRGGAKITDNPETQDQSPFDMAVEGLFTKHKVLSQLEKLDRVAQIGTHAILLLSVADGQPTRAPRGRGELAGIGVFDAAQATIAETDPDPARFGAPLTYKITMPRTLAAGGHTTQTSTQSIMVHYSRVIHFADQTDADPFIGQPRLLPIINALYDLDKVIGSAAEMFWLSGRGGLAVKTEASSPLGEQDLQAIKDAALAYQDTLARVLVMSNATAETIRHDVHSPKDLIACLIDLIAGATGIPHRILLGTEEGRLAGAQDAQSWYDRIAHRRQAVCEPNILRPFLTAAIDIGALPAPAADPVITFAPLAQDDETKKAQVALARSNALASYLNSGGDTLIPPQQFVEEVLGLEYSEMDVEDEQGEEGEEDPETQAPADTTPGP